MNKYIVIEGEPDGTYNANSKARKDAESILVNNCKFRPFYVHTVNGVEEKKIKKWKQLIAYRNNYRVWLRAIRKLNSGDFLFIQYPLVNAIFGLDKIMHILKEKGIKVIILIHDLESLRNSDKTTSIRMRRFIREDRRCLEAAYRTISHNDSMSKELRKMGCKQNKIIDLEVFDYLLDYPVTASRRLSKEVTIAGNLKREKAGYIYHLNKVKNLEFLLYGKGLELDCATASNIKYEGSALPEELPRLIKGAFGLVWDGQSIETCSGEYGRYLAINNPHKMSLYIASGMPVIVWEKSAVAKFVIAHNIGICIKSLHDIEGIIEKMDTDTYETMRKNVVEMSNEVQCGHYLVRAVNKCLNRAD